MPGKDVIQMSLRELKRLKVVQKVLDKAIKQINAAELLRISDSANSGLNRPLIPL